MFKDLARYTEEYWWLVAEGPRLGMQIADTVWNLDIDDIPEGNGTPIVVVPGFGTTNASTYFLRKVLNERGHNTVKWAVTRNSGFSEADIRTTVEQVKFEADKYGEPVNLLGQSLGGCFVRAMANLMPDHVNVAVSLGSPINGIDKIDPASVQKYNNTVGIVDAAIIHHAQFSHLFVDNPKVPFSSLFSRSDGVVHWSLSLIPEGEYWENIEIGSSHFGMGFSLETLKIIANRLHQHKESWYKYTSWRT